MSEVVYHLDVIPGRLEWLTSNQRLHWRVRAARTKVWREEAQWRAFAGNIPHLQRAHIVCEVMFSDRRRRDPANWAPTAKAIVDGLVDVGVFDDDNHQHVIGPDMRIGEIVGKEDRGVRVHIYPKETP